MDQMIKEFKRFDSSSPIGNFTLWDVVISLGLAFLLTLAIGIIYKRTHRGVSYSQSYVHTLFIMSVTVAFIMLIIGSNIARAFSLVGALSIIRFRHAMKDTRDIGFLFFSMAIGMACGTRFYMTAILGSALLCLMVYLLYKFDFAAKEDTGIVLKITTGEGLGDPAMLFEPIVRKHSDYFSLMSIEPIDRGARMEVLYYARLSNPAKRNEITREIGALKDTKVAFLLGQQSVDF